MKIEQIVSLTLLLFLVLVNRLSAQNRSWYIFGGHASLEVRYVNGSKPLNIKITSYKMFPERYIDIVDTIAPEIKQKTYEIPLCWPQIVNIAVSGMEFPVLLTPGSKLVCSVDLNSNQKVVFEGGDGLVQINNYLAKRESSDLRSIKSRRASVAGSASDLGEYCRKMDEIYRDEQQYFSIRKSDLPTWFKIYEYWNMRYTDAYSRMNAVLSRSLSFGKSESIPSTFYNFTDSLPINNKYAANIESYYLFLYELFNRNFEREKTNSGAPIDWLKYHLDQANSNLTGGIQDLYKAWALQLLFVHSNKNVAKEYITNNRGMFSDSIWRQQLVGFFKSKDFILKKDGPAPNFVLLNPEDSLVSLRSMKGNIVILSFWYAGCKPCIEEFPFENKLSEKFKDMGIKIVSICLNTTEKKWRESSKRFGLKTVNLWANPHWEKTVIEKYSIESFPRYVLLDKNLNVIEMDAARPSRGLEKQIVTLLND